MGRDGTYENADYAELRESSVRRQAHARAGKGAGGKGALAGLPGRREESRRSSVLAYNAVHEKGWLSQSEDAQPAERVQRSAGRA